ncbi:MAG: hypothetical protein CUN55_08645 [Phototrophicales bacterium]|nr:MAG: hypothetical protein CUN55_08645 [Phototrophicales bacterium]
MFRRVIVATCLIATLFAIPTKNSNKAYAQSNSSSCLFIFSLEEAKILIDEGDGWFDGLMEVEILLVTSEDTVSLPREGTYRVSQNETITFDEVRLLGTQDYNIIYLLFIEVDQPLISFSSITRLVVNSLASTIDPISGSILATLISEGVAYLEDLAFSDTIITEDSVLLSLDEDNMRQPIRYVTEDGHVEIVYTLDLTQGCSIN